MQDVQFRVISSLLAYPQMSLTVPSYLFAGYELEPVFRALKIEAEGEMTRKGLLFGILWKYPDILWETLRAVENSLCVPNESWAEYQLKRLKEMCDID